MSTQEPAAIVATVPRQVKERLREIAHQEKRSLTAHISWVLERHVEAKDGDGA